MDLEEMKEAWIALEGQLDKKEKLSVKIIREMYQRKAKRSLNKILWYEIIGVFVGLLVIPLLYWRITLNLGLWTQIVMAYWILFLITAIAWSLKKISLLIKTDTTDAVRNTVSNISRYTIWINKEKPVYVFTIALGFLLFGIAYWQAKATWQWALLVACVILTCLSTVWTYKLLYARSIRNIKESLKELEELED